MIYTYNSHWYIISIYHSFCCHSSLSGLIRFLFGYFKNGVSSYTKIIFLFFSFLAFWLHLAQVWLLFKHKFCHTVDPALMMNLTKRRQKPKMPCHQKNRNKQTANKLKAHKNRLPCRSVNRQNIRASKPGHLARILRNESVNFQLPNRVAVAKRKCKSCQKFWSPCFVLAGARPQPKSSRK